MCTKPREKIKTANFGAGGKSNIGHATSHGMTLHTNKVYKKLGVCADIIGFPSWQLCIEHPSFAPNAKQLTLWQKDVPKTMAQGGARGDWSKVQTWIVGHSKAPMYGTKKCDNDCNICRLCLSCTANNASCTPFPFYISFFAAHFICNASRNLNNFTKMWHMRVMLLQGKILPSFSGTSFTLLLSRNPSVRDTHFGIYQSTWVSSC
jgi:hypothetical protein